MCTRLGFFKRIFSSIRVFSYNFFINCYKKYLTLKLAPNKANEIRKKSIFIFFIYGKITVFSKKINFEQHTLLNIF